MSYFPASATSYASASAGQAVFVRNNPATAPGNPSVQGAGPATPITTGSGVTAPNATVPNANINPGTGQKYDPSNLNDINNPNNPANRK
jgi:hypothetical protein